MNSKRSPRIYKSAYSVPSTFVSNAWHSQIFLSSSPPFSKKWSLQPHSCNSTSLSVREQHENTSCLLGSEQPPYSAVSSNYLVVVTSNVDTAYLHTASWWDIPVDVSVVPGGWELLNVASSDAVTPWATFVCFRRKDTKFISLFNTGYIWRGLGP